MPLSEDEAARVAVLIDLREMAMTDEPSSPMVSAAHDPLERQELLSPVRLPYIQERAQRLQKNIAEAIRTAAEEREEES